MPVLLLAVACTSNNQQKGNKALMVDDVPYAQSKVVFYLPNSYLKTILEELIAKKKSEIYTSDYLVYGIEPGETSATTKKFVLVLLKDQSALLHQKSKAEIAKSLATVYAPANFLRKEITIELKDGSAQVSIQGLESSAVQLLSYPSQDLAFLLKSATTTHRQSGNAQMYLDPKAIVLDYSGDDNFRKGLLAYLSERAEFQNQGFSAVYPFKFLSDFMDTAKVVFESRNPLASGIRIYKVKMKNLPEDKVEAQFAITHSIFPADFQGKLELKRRNNTVLALKDVGYNKQIPLSAGEKAWMESKVKLIGDSITPALKDAQLVPSFKNASITVEHAQQTTLANIKSGRLRYFDESVIFVIDLKK
ncbi:hypothetical protein [Arcticibacter tournemirensis]|uniref:DUF4831 family protein n=1 Tax=Arcticibacter tournemirensis TaxID=699437 RepID=A0A4Q0M6V0_9SPHI|nr:hypothetical protein [Arcticibacter tournemirensis]RXF68603.1 hypothetical protein EKH83_14840 [Arcticibacter tournemirensis]